MIETSRVFVVSPSGEIEIVTRTLMSLGIGNSGSIRFVVDINSNRQVADWQESIIQSVKKEKAKCAALGCTRTDNHFHFEAKDRGCL